MASAWAPAAVAWESEPGEAASESGREAGVSEWVPAAAVTALAEAEPGPVPEDSQREADYCYPHRHHHTR